MLLNALLPFAAHNMPLVPLSNTTERHHSHQYSGKHSVTHHALMSSLPASLRSILAFWKGPFSSFGQLLDSLGNLIPCDPCRSLCYNQDFINFFLLALFQRFFCDCVFLVPCSIFFLSSDLNPFSFFELFLGAGFGIIHELEATCIGP